MDENQRLAQELQKKLGAVEPGERRLTDRTAYERYPQDLIKVFDDFARDYPEFAKSKFFMDIAEEWNRRVRAWETAPLMPRLKRNRRGFLSPADAHEEQARSGGVVQAVHFVPIWGEPVFLGCRVAHFHPAHPAFRRK